MMIKFNVERFGVFMVRATLCYEVEAETAAEAAAMVENGEAGWDNFDFRDIVETEYLDDIIVSDENGKIVEFEVIADKDEDDEDDDE